MTWQMLFVFGLLVVSFALMVWEKLSLDVIAMLVFSALLAAGILTPREAFRVFANEAAITVASMFILSAALERTGVIESIAHRLNEAVGRSDWSLLIVMLPIVAVLSAFVNNTPVVVVFMPIMITLAASRGLSPSKLLIPLSFASIFGGLCTLIGTSTNILVSSTAQELGQPPLGMFELGRAGWILAIVGLIYLLTIGRKLLPDRETLASILQSTESKQYLTEVLVVADSPLVGKTLAATPLANQPKARVLEVIRAGEMVYTPLDAVVLESGDRLRLSTPLGSVLELNQLKGVELLPKSVLGVELVGAQRAIVAECVIGPRSSLTGRSIRDLNFRRRYGVLVLAVHRHGENLRQDFADVKLHYGDTLLVEGPELAVRELRGHRDFLLLMDVPETTKRRHKQFLAVGAIACVVALAALNVLPIGALAVIAAVAVVATGCLDAEEAYEAVDWKIIFLIFGMLALGMALQKTQGAALVADTIIRGIGTWGPVVVLAAIVFLTSTLTNFLSNNAVAVLLTPVAIQAATALQLNVRPFLVAVALGASACFATPIGYQTNTLVYGAGGYKFRDFIKVGLPLNMIICILAVIIIPRLWPF
ncbi:MAG: SLC13 family permease [Chthoniobacterales bacterium]